MHVVWKESQYASSVARCVSYFRADGLVWDVLRSRLRIGTAMTAPREKCNGPGHKDIFDTKREAQDELRRIKNGRKARPGQGMVYRCIWGEHYHFTSHKKPGKGRR